jgi:ribosomal protein S8E
MTIFKKIVFSITVALFILLSASPSVSFAKAWPVSHKWHQTTKTVQISMVKQGSCTANDKVIRHYTLHKGTLIKTKYYMDIGGGYYTITSKYKPHGKYFYVVWAKHWYR